MLRKSTHFVKSSIFPSATSLFDLSRWEDAVTTGIGDIVNLLREPVAVDVAVRAGNGAGVGVAPLSPGRVGVLVAKLKVA